MKLTDLLETTGDELEVARRWYVDHCSNGTSWDDRFIIRNGAVHYLGTYLGLSCEEIKYPIAAVHELQFLRNDLRDNEVLLRSVKNMPEANGDITLGGHAVTVIDHPVKCGGRLNLARNQLTSLKDIHKFVSCRELTIFNNPLKSHVLGILLIPGIRRLSDMHYATLLDEFSDANHALAVIEKHVGKGRKGLLDAQQELLDAGLDEFAQL